MVWPITIVNLDHVWKVFNNVDIIHVKVHTLGEVSGIGKKQDSKEKE